MLEIKPSAQTRVDESARFLFRAKTSEFLKNSEVWLQMTRDSSYSCHSCFNGGYDLLCSVALNAESLISMNLSHRSFLQISFSTSGLLTLGGLIKYLGYQSETSSAQTTFTLDKPSTYSIGSTTHIAPARAWMFRDEKGLYAISTICPHLGCAVERREGDYLCPCHGSRFLQNGDVVNGPADRGLNYIKLTLTADGKVQLHVDKIVAPEERVKI